MGDVHNSPIVQTVLVVVSAWNSYGALARPRNIFWGCLPLLPIIISTRREYDNRWSAIPIEPEGFV
jgi:hypothetical protein